MAIYADSQTHFEGEIDVDAHYNTTFYTYVPLYLQPHKFLVTIYIIISRALGHLRNTILVSIDHLIFHVLKTRLLEKNLNLSIITKINK